MKIDIYISFTTWQPLHCGPNMFNFIVDEQYMLFITKNDYGNKAYH